MMTKIKLLMLVMFCLIISTSAHVAGGIALGTTRIIHSTDAKQTAVWIRNSRTDKCFLVNSWTENSSGAEEKSFIITLPLFASEPKSENTSRITYTGPPLATDCESLFRINIKTIPSVNKNVSSGRNVLQLAILSRMKLFLRPTQLQELSAEMPDTLKPSRSGSYINIHSLSPFYVTLVSLQVDDQKLGNATAASRVSSQIPLPSGVQGKLKFQTANNYGSAAPIGEVNLN